MKKIAIIAIILLIAGGVYAAKVITITTTSLNSMSVVVRAGTVECQIKGTTYDIDGNPVGAVDKVLSFDELPVQVRNNLNNVMKHMTRALNIEGANDDVENWVDQ